MDQAGWNARTRKRLEVAYLAATDDRGGSGFRGDAARWERARRPIAAGIDRDGTLLDIGCANGLLMDSIEEWAAQDGYQVEAHGLELLTPVAAAARARFPELAGRIHVGDVTTWSPGHRFTFVTTELAVVPPESGPALVTRILTDLVEPGGRLILTSYGSSHPDADQSRDVAELLASWGHRVVGSAQAVENDRAITQVAWIDA